MRRLSSNAAPARENWLSKPCWQIAGTAIPLQPRNRLHWPCHQVCLSQVRAHHPGDLLGLDRHVLAAARQVAAGLHQHLLDQLEVGMCTWQFLVEHSAAITANPSMVNGALWAQVKVLTLDPPAQVGARIARGHSHFLKVQHPPPPLLLAPHRFGPKVIHGSGNLRRSVPLFVSLSERQCSAQRGSGSKSGVSNM